MTKRSTACRLLVNTNSRLLSFGLLLLRWTVGGVLFIVGAGKLFGWFHGQGLAVTLQNYAKMGLTAPLSYLSILAEFIGGFLLIVGLLTRPAAFAVMINMLVATIVMLPRGFIVGGASYPFTLLVSSIIILLAGPMAYSLDSLVRGTTRDRKRSAVEFLDLVVGSRIDEAYEKYVDLSGRHHNVYFPAGFPALKAAMIENDIKYPNKRITVRNVLGDGDLVAVHSQISLSPAEPGMAVVHLFRFRGDRIVEFWDCGQPLPTDSPNVDGAF